MIALLIASFAHADPCDLIRDGLPDGAVAPFLYDGGLGRAHSACTRTEGGLAGGGYLVADTANFYGHIIAGATVDGRYAVNDDVEVFGSVEALRYETVIGALTSSYLGLGHTSVGVAAVVHRGQTTVLAVNGKTVLPTAFGLYQNAWPIGADLGVSGVWAKCPKFRVHGQVGGLGSGATGAAGAQIRVGAEANLGAEWRPAKAFGLVGEVDAGFGYTAPLDHLALGVGLRTAAGKRFGLELAGLVPVAGRERALASLSLRADVRFGREPEPVLLGLPVEPKAPAAP